MAGPSSCGGSAMSCTIEELPAGTTTLVKVQAGSSAGWGESSEISYAATLESDSSRDCASMLQKQADGDYVAEGTIIAAVFGAFAILIIIAAVLFYLKRRQPPPPPPGGMKGAAPAY